MAKEKYKVVGAGALLGSYREDGDIIEAEPLAVKFLLLSGRVKLDKPAARKAKPKAENKSEAQA